jgi:hypothetical protein
MSPFYQEGYTDATKGLKASPPAPYCRSDGLSTDVFAREYLEGYNAALRAMVNFHEIHESIKQDRKAGNEQ